MAQEKPKWSWAETQQRLQQAIFRKQHNPVAERDQPDELDNNPWVSLHEHQRTGTEHTKRDVEDHPFARERTTRTPPRQNTRWLSDQSSPYGFVDDDGTLKQVDGANWRKMFGNRKNQRFVAKGNNTSKWQTGGTNTPQQTTKSAGGTWLMQTVAAAVLVAAGIYAHNTPGELPGQIQSLYQSAFAADYSNVAVPAVEHFLNEHHIAIPTFHNNAGAIKLHVPLSGKVIADYSTTHPEMFIQGTSDETVLAAGSGTVTQVANVSGGVMVVINHGSLGYSTYTGLSDASVTKGQAVSSGEAIGHLAKSDKPVLKFALQQDGHFVNPHDYIQFPDDSV